MAATVSYDSVEVGTELPGAFFAVGRVNLVQYCGASGDVNVIHWNERIAKAVGLPDVIAHGMFTMAEAGRVVTDWVGDPGAVLSYSVRFSKPVVVPDDDKGAVLSVNSPRPSATPPCWARRAPPSSSPDSPSSADLAQPQSSTSPSRSASRPTPARRSSSPRA